MDNSGNRADLEEDLTPTTGARHWNNIRSGADASPSRSRGSSGKRKQRDETDDMTFMAMQEIIWVSTQSTDDNVALLRFSFMDPTYLPSAARCR
ncbi:hypothetical protein TIFTF001_001548 [Ficus carica]|uniref:Uncharacterized protein n=1 Tax=Ficus carica TaxID=3494 RepID=A0AA88CMH1_FICCA|nr:hypothetical protein TIFTF001_001548 [Ficus carica]